MATQERLLSEQDTFPVEVFIRRNREDPMRANPHWHDCFEILYVLQGQARYIAEEKACDILNRFSKNGQWTKRPLCRKIDLYRGCSYVQEQIHTSASVRGRNTGYAGDGIDTARDSRAAWIE